MEDLSFRLQGEVQGLAFWYEAQKDRNEK
jgi:hypothetical protein